MLAPEAVCPPAWRPRRRRPIPTDRPAWESHRRLRVEPRGQPRSTPKYKVKGIGFMFDMYVDALMGAGMWKRRKRVHSGASGGWNS